MSKPKLSIVFIGDSITESGALKDPATEAPPARAAAYLGESKKVELAGFSNQGHGGATTLDFLAGSGYYEKVVAAATELRKKDKTAALWFSIMLGTNDSAIKGTHGAPVSPADYVANLKSIIDSLHTRFPDSRFVLQYPLWYSANTYNSAMYLQEGQGRLQQYAAQIDRLIAGYAKTLPGKVYAGDRKGYAYFKKNHLTDMLPQQGQQGIFYLHPNVKGSQYLGELWGKAIEKVVKK